MGQGRVLVGNAESGRPSPSSPEHAAHEYHVNRRMAGDFAPRPPVERWRADQRERFEAELARLEEQNRPRT